MYRPPEFLIEISLILLLSARYISVVNKQRLVLFPGWTSCLQQKFLSKQSNSNSLGYNNQLPVQVGLCAFGLDSERIYHSGLAYWGRWFRFGHMLCSFMPVRSSEVVLLVCPGTDMKNSHTTLPRMCWIFFFFGDLFCNQLPWHVSATIDAFVFQPLTYILAFHENLWQF